MKKSAKLSAIFLGTAFASAMTLVGCGGNAATPTSGSHPGNSNPDGLYQDLGSWPLPPQFQGNPFGSGGVGSAGTFVFEGLFQFVRSTDKVYNHLAESIDNSVPNQTTVHIRKDAKWSDGKPFTSKDVWAYYMLNNGEELTHYLTNIETPDDYTVVFKWANPAPFDEMKTLFMAEAKQGQIPYHYYKQWVDKAVSILKQAKPDTDPKDLGNVPFGLKITTDLQKQLSDNWNDFAKHGPKFPLGTGAYVVKRVTATDMTLEKNPYFYGANKVKFKTIDIKMINDLNQQYALLKGGKLDSYPGTPPKDIVESILSANKNLVLYKMFDPASVGFMFNETHKPFDNTTFRQAVIYALDRQKIREVANYYGNNTELSGTGMPTSEVNKWIDPSLLSKFTKYPHDEQKAAKLLQSIGWTKGTDGIWKDKDGKSFNFIIASDQGWVPAVNAGEVVAEQLTSFGLPTKYKAVDGSIYYNNATSKTSAYDMSFNWMDVSWGFGFPWNSMRNTYSDTVRYAHIPITADGQLNFVRPGFDGQSVNPQTLLHQIPYMTTDAERRHAIDEIAYVTNESAFEVNLFQNTTGWWHNLKTIGGNPWMDALNKYNRNMPVPTDPALIERIAETNEGFAGEQWLIDGTYYPN